MSAFYVDHPGRILLDSQVCTIPNPGYQWHDFRLGEKPNYPICSLHEQFVIRISFHLGGSPGTKQSFRERMEFLPSVFHFRYRRMRPGPSKYEKETWFVVGSSLSMARNPPNRYLTEKWILGLRVPGQRKASCVAVEKVISEDSFGGKTHHSRRSCRVTSSICMSVKMRPFRNSII